MEEPSLPEVFSLTLT